MNGEPTNTQYLLAMATGGGLAAIAIAIATNLT